MSSTMTKVLLSLLRPEEAIACITQTGDNVCVFIQSLVETGAEDGNIRIVAVHICDSFRRRNQTNILNVFYISLF